MKQPLFQESNVSTQEIIEKSVMKFRNQFVLILILICTFEIFMFIRGLITFDLTETRRILYLITYVSLFLSSLAGIFTVINSYKKPNEKTNTHISGYVQFYVIFILIWATFISSLDLFAYYPHPPVVFMTVIMGVAALAFIRPKLLLIIVIPLAILIGIFCITSGDKLLSGSGFLSNFVIFVIITFFISFRQFRQNQHDYIVMKRLENFSYHDQLTGAYNRMALHEHLIDNKDNFFFGIIDLDNFKSINDTHGHDFGDQVLVKLTSLLQEYYGSEVFRYGGDEFVVVTNLRSSDIEEKFDSINQRLKDSFPKHDLAISAGFYQATSVHENYEDFLRHADCALYSAKQNGKHHMEFYKPFCPLN